jgi:hypothetical protein
LKCPRTEGAAGTSPVAAESWNGSVNYTPRIIKINCL